MSTRLYRGVERVHAIIVPEEPGEYVDSARGRACERSPKELLLILWQIVDGINAWSDLQSIVD